MAAISVRQRRTSRRRRRCSLVLEPGKIWCVVLHPDAPGALLHFTGRTRGYDDQPPAFAIGTPERRLARILQTGWLLASGTYGTVGPVLCFSELSDAALSVLLTTGLNDRGPYPPWG